MKRVTTHPGTVLLEDYMKPKKMTKADMARKLSVSETVVSMIVNGKRGVSFEMALKLSKALRTSFEFWSNLQFNYDKSLFLSSIKKKNFNRLKLPRRKVR